MNANEIYLSAESFKDASDILTKQLGRTHDPALIAPIFLNLSLSLELYFKCLFFIENGDLPERIHLLSKLYSKLSIESRKAIEQRFNMLIEMSPVAQSVKKDYTNLDWSIYTLLQQYPNIFVDIRYLFDKQPKYNVFGMGEIVDATRERIVHLMLDTYFN